MVEIKFIDHIVVVVKDVSETAGFYSVFLGEPTFKDQDQVVFKIGETKLFFGLAYKDYKWHDKDHYGLNHLAFGLSRVEELEALGERLNKAGIKNSGIQIDKYSQKEFIWFDDPDGYRLEFYLAP
ncbi:MAG: hypothetical protein COV31_02080 [Candidatus Yanofskybacteria bacterium CG10_big_fil_rev_8_21_14_0_10_46_23]|uniref:VOC domain-containing protein n=1 Tax=Candidatus Yanofskybacteria bacterium CG10_big_fil_rev_8_21_14_0_10_46_23 TaxID=1975098 RepID=A0A2H0R4D8_9BACT|nr:MAG: hypothetical protein COV31_02080 [Candidatus Yanofskybacteria bacterium CG10_big_fil_rev_8_21_14_0_10_46_23]